MPWDFFTAQVCAINHGAHVVFFNSENPWNTTIAQWHVKLWNCPLLTLSLSLSHTNKIVSNVCMCAHIFTRGTSAGFFYPYWYECTGCLWWSLMVCERLSNRLVSVCPVECGCTTHNIPRSSHSVSLIFSHFILWYWSGLYCIRDFKNQKLLRVN